MKFYLKIFFLLAILITITFKILIGMESEKSTQDQEKTKTSSIGLPLKAEDTGISRLPKMSTTTFGMFDNSCSILQ